VERHVIAMERRVPLAAVQGRRRGVARLSEALDGVRVALRLLDFVEPIVVHSEFRDRLNQAEVSL
jgi:hypothetical protein